MRPFRLLALALAVAALGAFIYFYERHEPTTDQRAERKDKLFATLEADQATRVVIDNSHGRFELAKEDGEWKLVAPVADDANQGTVAGLLSTLSSLKAERTLAVGEVKLADFGLDPPTLGVRVEGATGTLAALKLGSELPLGNTRAALTDGRNVVLVSKFVATDVDRDLAGWRSDQLARVFAADVVSLTVARGTERVALAQSSGVWTMTEPVTDLADRERAEGLISDIGAARIKEFLDAAGDAAAVGLGAPSAEVTIVRKDKPPLKLSFGSERTKGGSDQVACRRGNRAFWVEKNAAARATAVAEEWRAKQLVQLDTWAADTFALTAASKKAELTKEDGQWKAGSTVVDGGAVSRRLGVLADLQVQAFDRAQPAVAELGHVKVKAEGGAMVEATFYPGASEAEAIAVVAGRSGAMAVDGARVGELLADPPALAAPKPTPAPTSAPSLDATPVTEVTQ
jgi:hypothetical protein